MKIASEHDFPITSIAFSSRINTLITTSLDGSLKFWKVTTSPFSMKEAKKVYAQEASFLHVSLHKVTLEGNIPVETLVTVKTSNQISTNNAYPYEITVETNFLELLAAKVPSKMVSLPAPLRLIQHMTEEGIRKAVKKKALLGKLEREEI